MSSTDILLLLLAIILPPLAVFLKVRTDDKNDKGKTVILINFVIWVSRIFIMINIYLFNEII